MAITSLTFLLFIFITLIVYYLVPKRQQWIVLLLASIIFYLSCGVKSILYVLITATTIYFATRAMHLIAVRQKAYLKAHKADLSREEKNQYKVACKHRRKAVMLAALLINIGLLCVFKYFHFALEQINVIAGWFGGNGVQDHFNLIVPLGISFYTFQSIGYLVDVYWEYYEPEQNYLKVLLFVSFFPQMTQGPISDFEALSKELFSPHSFTYKNYSWGFQRMLWGFAKKLLLADLLAVYVQDVFANYSQYSGITVFIGALMYSVQIYADFSGYMDIMIGYCEMLGIRLTENFERPYFSKSIAEYWRRWHISLGAWFKKYIYYPIGMSTWSRRFAKNTQQRFGKHFANTMPATIALVVTWLATGLWHGASWAYAIWGLINGLFIILTLWMEPVYDRWKAALNINEQSQWWKLFQVIRTFILVTFIKVLPEVGTIADGWGLWKRIFTEHSIPRSLSGLLPFVNGSIVFAVIISMTIVLFIFSLIQRKQQVRSYFNRLPVFVRIIVMSGLLTAICIWGDFSARGFMYANF